MELNRILELAGKANYTTEEKKEIREAARVAGLSVVFGGKCLECYNDALMLMRNKIIGEQAEDDKTTKSGKWVYMKSEAVEWEGCIMDAATDDETIERFVKLFPNYYKRASDEDSNND